MSLFEGEFYSLPMVLAFLLALVLVNRCVLWWGWGRHLAGGSESFCGAREPVSGVIGRVAGESLREGQPEGTTAVSSGRSGVHPTGLSYPLTKDELPNYKGPEPKWIKRRHGD